MAQTPPAIMQTPVIMATTPDIDIQMPVANEQKPLTVISKGLSNVRLLPSKNERQVSMYECGVPMNKRGVSMLKFRVC